MKKVMSLLSLMVLAVGVTVGCSNSSDTEKASSDSAETTAYTGVITAAGSTALQPLAEEAATEFTELNPEVSITVQGGGSGTGINQVASGAAQIGNSDVPSAEKVEDSSLKLVDTKVAGIGFAIVVNEDVEVDSLTTEQIQDIFSGKVTNWQEIGGNDEEIQVINRPASSGTRTTFEKTIMEEAAIDDSVGTIQESNGSVEQAVNSTSGAVSYLAMSYLVGDKKEALKTVKINGAEASNENITNGDYPFWSYEYMVTNGEPSDAVKGFIDYVKSEEFASTVEAMGYIPIKNLE